MTTLKVTYSTVEYLVVSLHHLILFPMHSILHRFIYYNPDAYQVQLPVYHQLQRAWIYWNCLNMTPYSSWRRSYCMLSRATAGLSYRKICINKLNHHKTTELTSNKLNSYQINWTVIKYYEITFSTGVSKQKIAIVLHYHHWMPRMQYSAATLQCL